MKRRELIDSLMGLKISSTFLIWVLLCRYIGALKKGIFFFICSPWKWSHRERQWLEWWEIWACLVVRRMYDVFCLVGIVIAELSFNYLGGNF